MAGVSCIGITFVIEVTNKWKIIKAKYFLLELGREIPI